MGSGGLTIEIPQMNMIVAPVLVPVDISLYRYMKSVPIPRHTLHSAVLLLYQLSSLSITQSTSHSFPSSSFSPTLRLNPPSLLRLHEMHSLQHESPLQSRPRLHGER